MRLISFFEKSSDILQYLLPASIGMMDVFPSLRKKNYVETAKKALIICGLILLQNRGTMAVKKLTNKPRPNGKNLESFPSGHMMIAIQCLVRSIQRDGITSYTFAWALISSTFIGLGRYLPGNHDLIDLTCGGLLGAGLGCAWNQLLD